jgi:Ala-tRNA(Pro) deacylase
MCGDVGAGRFIPASDWCDGRSEEVSDVECKQRLEEYLHQNAVPYEVMTHREAYTMPEVAAALHVPGHQVAKVVIIKADSRMVMLVVPSPYRLDLRKVSHGLGARKVSLATEEEFAELFPDCVTGAMPPFGNLYEVPVYVDRVLTEQSDIIFRVGTHRQTMKISYQDFARLVSPTVGDFVLT